MADLARSTLGIDTLAIHAGQPPDPSTQAVMTPIVLSSTFAQRVPGQPGAYEYSRSGNPTRGALEACLAALEGGRHGLAYASGTAATLNFVHALKRGDHVVCGDDVYGGTYRLFSQVAGPMGIGVDFVDLSSEAALDGAIRAETRMVWAETPTNPLLKLFDIEAMASTCRKLSIPLVVDNTFASPVLQRPLDLGATAVLHSTTKYLNGHSDVVGGAIVTSDDALAERLRFLQNALGAIPSPMDCYLVLRGLKTLGVRMRQHSASAQRLAELLERHPKVERVSYPGLPSHPNHALAARQMALGGGMITAVVSGGLPAAKAFLGKLRVFTLAESLGGVESLAEHPALMTHQTIPAAVREGLGIVDGLVRLSVGLEDPEDLWSDLSRALEA